MTTPELSHDEAGDVPDKRRRCFIISPIGEEGSAVRAHADDVMEFIIKPALVKCGIVGVRSDQMAESGTITEQMFREIVTADVCVVVATGFNPNVFYELAVAQSAARPVVILIEKGQALPFDVKDLRCIQYEMVPISRLVNQPMVVVVKDKQKYPTVAALIAAAKAAPGKITYASSGDGSPQHLAGLMFETRTQTKLLHVPYRGGALAINDTLGGTVDAMFAVMPEAVPHVLSGKLAALGVMSPTRSPVLPQVPTMAESGVADLNLSAWMALLAPAKMPRALIDQLNRAVQAAFDPELKAKLAESGIEVATSSPEEVQRLITSDIKLHAELVKIAGLVPQ